jgi:predicted naringenin-chalcone synthase
MSSIIFALSTVVPTYLYKQQDVAQKFIDILSIEQEKVELLNRIYQNSAIEKRYSVIDDFHKPREEWKFWGVQYPQTIPGMTERNLRYKKDAPQLAEKAAQQVLEKWGGQGKRITHIISVSCTGVLAPGIEYYLMQNLGLPPTVNRIGINFMGCFGAFKGLSVARAFTQEDPDARILLVCTELCSLHLQADDHSETLTANSLFSDGSAAAIIGGNPQNDEKPLWDIIRTYSLGFKNSLDKMSWEASDRGFLMRLSHTVPVLIGRHMQEFARGLLRNEVQTEQCDWAIHPGGKSILQAVERSLQLQPDQTKSSWDILANYGNMSSATLLFVFESLSRQSHLRPWTAGVGFGPGLSAEGILLQSSQKLK